MPCAPQRSPQRHGVSRDHRPRETCQRAARAVFQGQLPTSSPIWQGRVNDGEVAAAERDLGYQSPEGVLKDVITGDSYFGGDS
jgi:hypothetical protein